MRPPAPVTRLSVGERLGTLDDALDLLQLWRVDS